MSNRIRHCLAAAWVLLVLAEAGCSAPRTGQAKRAKIEGLEERTKQLKAEMRG